MIREKGDRGWIHIESALKSYLKDWLAYRRSLLLSKDAPLRQLVASLERSVEIAARFESQFAVEASSPDSDDELRRIAQSSHNEAKDYKNRLSVSLGSAISRLGEYEAFFSNCEMVITRVEASIRLRSQQAAFKRFKTDSAALLDDTEKVMLRQLCDLQAAVFELEGLVKGISSSIPASVAQSLDGHQVEALEAVVSHLVAADLPSVGTS